MTQELCTKCATPLPADESGGGRIECTNCGESNFSGYEMPPYEMQKPESDNSENQNSPQYSNVDLNPILEPVIEVGQPHDEIGELDIEISPTEKSVPQEENFSDIVGFGNSEVTSSASGGLVYNVHIEGVDTVELRGEIRAVLEDARFALDARALMKSIHEGKLELQNLNPVKASVFLSRIKHLPLQVTWKADQLVRK